MHPRRRSVTLLPISVVLTIAMSGCSRPPAPAAQFDPRRVIDGIPLAPNVHCGADDCRSYTVEPYVRTRTRYGIGCMGNVPPRTEIPAELPPMSYAVSDLGKPGVPELGADDAAKLARIVRTHPSPSLRFAWLRRRDHMRIIVFDATDGPCEVWAAGYAVLNGGCNEFYEPGENPYTTHPGSGCWPAPR